MYDIGTLASVYHKPAETFIAGKKFGADNVNKSAAEYVYIFELKFLSNLLVPINSHTEDDDINAPPPMIQEAIKNNDIGNLLDLDWDAPTETPVSPIMGDHQQQQGSFSDLLSVGNPDAKASPSRANSNNNIDDIMNLFNTPSSAGAQTFTSSPQQQQQQQHQNVMNDFTNDFFGSAPTQSPVQQQPSSSKNTATNDPFADLF